MAQSHARQRKDHCLPEDQTEYVGGHCSQGYGFVTFPVSSGYGCVTEVSISIC